MYLTIFWLYSTLLTISNGQILGKIIDNLACRRTSNNGFYGECIPRRCCSSVSAVRNLCLTSTDTVCCYGPDRCRLNEDDVLIRRRIPSSGILIDRPVSIGSNYPNRGLVDYCDRYVVSRVDWQALPPTKRPYRMPVRVDTVIVHHTGDYSDQCWSLEQCRQRLRQMQNYYQQEKRFPDIPWNFLISNNGDIYEGVGWDSQGYHTEQWNDRSLGIAFIGDYDREQPSHRAIRALIHLLDCGVEQHVLDRYYRLHGHRDMKSTACPGDYLYEALTQVKSSGVISGNRVVLSPSSGDVLDEIIDEDEDEFRRFYSANVTAKT